MARIKLTNRKLQNLVAGLNALVGQDLDPMLGFKCSTILEACEPATRAFDRTKRKQDEKYVKRDPRTKERVTGEGGGFQIQEGKQEEYRDRIETLMDAGVHIRCPRLRLSELVKEWEMEKEVPGWVVHALRPVLVMDVELPEGEDGEEDVEVDATGAAVTVEGSPEEIPAGDGARPEPAPEPDAEPEEADGRKPRRRSRASVGD